MDELRATLRNFANPEGFGPVALARSGRVPAVAARGHGMSLPHVPTRHALIARAASNP
jgi:hypothetical protein